MTRLNSGIGMDSATSSKLSLLTIANTCLENKSYFISKSSISSGRLEVKPDAFPCNVSIRNSGHSFIILIFMVLTNSELLYYLVTSDLRVLFAARNSFFLDDSCAPRKPNGSSAHDEPSAKSSDVSDVISREEIVRKEVVVKI